MNKKMIGMLLLIGSFMISTVGIILLLFAVLKAKNVVLVLSLIFLALAAAGFISGGICILKFYKENGLKNEA